MQPPPSPRLLLQLLLPPHRHTAGRPALNAPMSYTPPPRRCSVAARRGGTPGRQSTTTIRPRPPGSMTRRAIRCHDTELVIIYSNKEINPYPAAKQYTSSRPLLLFCRARAVDRSHFTSRPPAHRPASRARCHTPAVHLRPWSKGAPRSRRGCLSRAHAMARAVRNPWFLK